MNLGSLIYFKKLHAQVEVGTVLIVPVDNRLPRPPKKPAIYEAVVVGKDINGFTTDLVKGSYQRPLAWHENYNFAGAKIKK